MARPIPPARTLWRIESSPRVAEMTLWARILTGTGRAPALSWVARNLASSRVKLPEIMASPVVISDWTVGAERRELSSRMASGLPKNSRVNLANSSRPESLNLMETAGWRSWVSKVTWAKLKSLPVRSEGKKLTSRGSAPGEAGSA